ncbi:MAG: glycosyltransferase family 4 protein [Christensenellales bacterium]
MPRVLFTASVFAHLKAFHVPYIQHFRERGYEVHTAANGENTLAAVDRHFDIDFHRSPLSPKNIRGYRALKRLIDENGYDIIHCHTPVVGVLTRLAARGARKRGTVVIYTAHGFHFYKGAPPVSGRVFRMLEKRLSRYTDHLITINAEDYSAALRYGFRAGACHLVHGVGVDAERFAVQTPETKRRSRELFGIPPDAFVLVFAAEYSRRKNQGMLLDAVSILKERVPETLLLLPGDGPLKEAYGQRAAALGIADNVWLMGFRDDMDRLLPAADVAVSSSIQEGLPINIVEAMAVSLPVVATRIRGHVDLVGDGTNGYLVPTCDAEAMADRLLHLHDNPDTARAMQARARETAEPFLLHNARAETTLIYDTIIYEKQGARKDGNAR